MQRQDSTNGPAQHLHFRLGDPVKYKSAVTGDVCFGRITAIFEHQVRHVAAENVYWVLLRPFLPAGSDIHLRFWSARLLQKRAMYILGTVEAPVMVTNLLSTVGMFHDCQYLGADIAKTYPASAESSAGVPEIPPLGPARDPMHPCRVVFSALCAAHCLSLCKDPMCMLSNERSATSKCNVESNSVFYYEPWFDFNVVGPRK